MTTVTPASRRASDCCDRLHGRGRDDSYPSHPGDPLGDGAHSTSELVSLHGDAADGDLCLPRAQCSQHKHILETTGWSRVGPATCWTAAPTGRDRRVAEEDEPVIAMPKRIQRNLVTEPEGTPWGPTLDDLARRRVASRAMGGQEKLARRAASGKLDARARINALLDPDSFRELGTLAGGAVPADAIVTGHGLVAGRPVMVGAEDFTTLGGTIGSASNAKRYRIAELALASKIPLVMLLEGAGFRPEDGPRGRAPVDLLMQARCSGKVPVVTGVLGPSAGHGALIAPMSDFCVMTEQAAIFTAGPPVVRQSTGEEVSKEDLGGPLVAVASGLVHNVAADDVAAIEQIRRYLRYFPSSAWSYPAGHSDGDVGPRSTARTVGADSARWSAGVRHASGDRSHRRRG